MRKRAGAARGGQAAGGDPAADRGGESALPAGQIQAQDYHSLGVMFFAAKDFAAAASAFELARKQQADFPDVALNLGLCLILTERPREAIPELLKALEDRPDSLDATDGLAHAYGKLGDFENSRIYGEKSLRPRTAWRRSRRRSFIYQSNRRRPFALTTPRKTSLHSRYSAISSDICAGR